MDYGNVSIFTRNIRRAGTMYVLFTILLNGFEFVTNYFTNTNPFKSGIYRKFVLKHENLLKCWANANACSKRCLETRALFA